MFKKLVIVIIALVFLGALVGCSTETPAPAKTIIAEAGTTSTTTAPQPVVEEETAMDLTGSWAFEENDFAMKAEVSLNAIQINMVAGDSEGLYWAGTFVPEAEAGNSVVSKADVDLLARSLFGSQDKKKTFAITEDTIEFPFTMMGVTKTVKLER